MNFQTGNAFRPFLLEEILEHHETLATEIVSRTKPFQYFSNYLQTGYYPYFLEGLDVYLLRLEETVQMYLFKGSHVDIGTVREAFLANQLSYLLQLAFSESGDFLVDGHYTI
ncbi:MAG: hypothetical protein Q8O15_08010 [Rectinemataceae bacterium]|nr:hypothetical protein [Rectinemataceae bacterium]